MLKFARIALAVLIVAGSVLPAATQSVAPSSPPTTQNTVTTTGPVQSTTTIETGTIAGEALKWVAAAFAATIGTVLTGWLVRLFKLAGVQGAELLRDKLQEVILNGLNAAAAAAATNLQGKGKIETKNIIVQQAVAYTQAHAAETITALGLDPKSGAAVEAIKARIETAIADPASPTPAVLGGPAPIAAKV